MSVNKTVIMFKVTAEKEGASSSEMTNETSTQIAEVDVDIRINKNTLSC